MDELSKIRELAEKWLSGTISEKEKEIFEEWYNSQPEAKVSWSRDASEQELKERLLMAILNKQEQELEIKEVPMRRNRIYRWTAIAAASVVIALGIGTYLLFFNKKTRQPLLASQQVRFKNDVDPGRFKAKLTLANGNSIVLDSAQNGELAKQGNTVVVNKNGQLVYEEKPHSPKEVVYNTLSTSRGETYSTVLSDGTKIWLNSASSVTYPVAFSGNEREVKITGEVYFAVKHNSAMPFIVMANGMELEDLGTEFNINAYNDEPAITTTLVSGIVKVSREPGVSGRQSTAGSDKSIVMIPGQQVQWNTAGGMKLIANADVEQAIAWKNGFFELRNTDIETIMRQVSRWYDVDIHYQDKISQLFIGDIPRAVKVSELFKILESTGWVHFKIDGRTITVMK